MRERKTDPNCITFDKKWGDLFRIGLRAWMWFLCFLQAIYPFISYGIFQMTRIGNGSGVSSCIDKRTFNTSSIVGLIDYETALGETPIILVMFPQLVYVEVFVYLMLFIVHVDICTRKKISLDASIMLRLQ